MNIKNLPKNANAKIIHTSISVYNELNAKFVYRTDEDSLLIIGTDNPGVPDISGFFKKEIPKVFNDFEVEIISEEEFKSANIWNRKKKIKVCDTKITLQEWNLLTDEQKKQHIKILE